MGTEKIVPIVPTVPNPGKWGVWRDDPGTIPGTILVHS
jgi:hypothetical protein